MDDKNNPKDRDPVNLLKLSLSEDIANSQDVIKEKEVIYSQIHNFESNIEVGSQISSQNFEPKKPDYFDKSKEFLDIFNGDFYLAAESLKKTKEFLDINKPRQVAQSNRPKGKKLVEIKNVTKTYKLGRQKVEALKGVTLDIYEGEFVAITGSSGSGKSTLLQLLGGLDKPTTGSINIDGHDIARLTDKNLSKFRNKTIGFVFQFFYLQPFLKVQTNLEVPGMFARTTKKLRHEKALSLAKSVGLEDRLDHYPKQMSGGQMQRAAIARALLNEPKLLLADEPTGNLDSQNSSSIIDLFEKIRNEFGTTVVVVTHDENISARADRKIIVSDGVVIQ
jgi:ABC-type lipoprotein export system ATPase subunit